ncbi:hypothetical protein [Luteimonas sp. SDU101]|uniref:hypothetical protein n=1 Tax=Luteimonas sp. SDU101 TaxID=3422593 RepID=UPI003EB72C49
MQQKHVITAKIQNGTYMESSPVSFGDIGLAKLLCGKSLRRIEGLRQAQKFAKMTPDILAPEFAHMVKLTKPPNPFLHL